MDQVMLRDRRRFDDLVEQFTAGVLGDGVTPPVVEVLRASNPPAAELAPRLLDLVCRAGDKGRFAVASLAVELAADAGYRPVVEAVVRRHPLPAAYQPWFLMKGTRLEGEALCWWLDLVADDPSAISTVNYALHRRRDLVLAADRDVVITHLLRTDAGPARHAADLAAEVLRRGGPCAPLEAMFSRWIRDGRFDHGVDTADGSTSADVLAACLERCVVGGPFTVRWALVGQALEHWRGLLSTDDDHLRRRGLTCMAALLAEGTSLAGALPRGLARPRVPEWRTIQRGFSAINAGESDRRTSARIDDAIRACHRAPAPERGAGS